MTADKAEEWIVNLIRNAKMEAKIDTAEVGRGCRQIGRRPPPLLPPHPFLFHFSFATGNGGYAVTGTQHLSAGA